jgi:hypothetical protein
MGTQNNGHPFRLLKSTASAYNQRSLVPKNTVPEYGVRGGLVTQFQARWTKDISWGV